jgi:short subunit dehydrogenase-like uncharacterized protein
VKRNFDLILFGATGFTGRLVAEYLHTHHGVGGPLRWAIAGRSLHKLEQVRESIGASDALPLLVAAATDASALAAVVGQARVVISTIGPYQQHGQPLVTACAQAGTDYVDLCGEPAWMARMIPLLQPLAEASGARIVFSCGFDSIPFDLGVVFLQDEARRRFGKPLQQVRGRVVVIKGDPSGGTIASAMATFEAMARDPAVARSMADPFALTPGFRGPTQPDGGGAVYDELAQAWAAPFVMAAINTKNVHRTNALCGHPWGRDFVYDERLLAGTGRAGELRARHLARQDRVQSLLLRFGPTRALLRRFALPQPGQGPSARQREKGHYQLSFSGRGADGQVLRAQVTGDRDPGYGSTSKMIAESALCLLNDVDQSMTAGGVWTPGAAMGLALVRRLRANAGLGFEIGP